MNRVFRLGRRPRRVAFVTGLAAAIVLGVALPAWAHHPILSGKTECTNGDHVVSWTIGNSRTDIPMTITSATAAIGATEYLVTGYDSTVAKSGKTHATTIVPGNVTGTIELTVTGTWPDGFTTTRQTSVTLVDTCVQPTTTTTVGGTTTFATTTTTVAVTTTPITGEGSTNPTVVNLATTTTQPGAGAGTLPRTGSSSGYAVYFALSCIAGGALLLIRRRSWAR